MWGEYKHPFSMTSIPKSSQFITKPCSSAPANTKQMISETGNALYKLHGSFISASLTLQTTNIRNKTFAALTLKKKDGAKIIREQIYQMFFKNKSLKAFFNTSASVCRCPIM